MELINSYQLLVTSNAGKVSAISHQFWANFIKLCLVVYKLGCSLLLALSAQSNVGRNAKSEYCKRRLPNSIDKLLALTPDMELITSYQLLVTSYQLLVTSNAGKVSAISHQFWANFIKLCLVVNKLGCLLLLALSAQSNVGRSAKSEHCYRRLPNSIDKLQVLTPDMEQGCKCLPVTKHSSLSSM